MTDDSRISWALVVSVLLHGLLLSMLPLMRRAHIDIPQPQLVDVDLAPLPKAVPPPARPLAPAVPAPAAPAPPAIPVPKQQVVSPPEEGEEKEPPNPRFLSDRNNTVKEEMIHRAQPAAGDPEAKQKAPPAAPAPKEHVRAKAERAQPAPEAQPVRPRPNTQVAALPKLDQLLPPAGDMIREGVVQPQPSAPAPAEAPQQQASAKRTDLLRHGDPWRSGGVRGGSLDFLPAVREGDITLLNTKAEQFAPFVRRVAVRVFENFWILVRHRVYGSFSGSAEEYATLEAVMNKQGQLIALNVKDRSVSVALATDQNLQSACREGFFDRNPPPGAEANDGNIHFLFQARVAVSFDATGRGPYGGALLGAGLL